MFVILSPFVGVHPTSKGHPMIIDQKEGNHFVKTFSDRNPLGAPPKMATLFDIEEMLEPTSLATVFEQVVEPYRNKSHCFAIRYTPVAGIGTERLRRVSDNFKSTPPSPIIFMDIDSIILPNDIAWYEVEKQARYVCKILHDNFPEYFPENMAYIAKASGSAGVKAGTIRLHLYLENTTYLTTEQMAYLVYEVINKKIADLIDPAPYHARQPHYIADPVFLDSQVDPFKQGGYERVCTYIKKGTTGMSTIPANTPRHIARDSVTLTAEHAKFFDNTIGERYYTERLHDHLDVMKDSEDSMFVAHVPRLYHMAWEDGISLEFLEKQPTKHDRERHGLFLQDILRDYKSVTDGRRSINDYFQNGRKACMTKIVQEAARPLPTKVNVPKLDSQWDSRGDLPENLRSATWVDGDDITMLPTDSTLEDQYLKLSNLPPSNELTFIKASLGTGKTTAVKLWLAKGQVSGRFLSITNTRALVDSNAKIFNAPENEAYRKHKYHSEFYNDANGRMSTTIHSIHRYKEMAELGMIDFVFIDEADAVMNELINSTLIRDRTKCTDTLGELLSSAKFVVLSDGDVGKETIEAYHGLCRTSKKINVIEHKRDMLKGATAYEIPKAEAIWAITSASISHGDKVLVVTDMGPDNLNIRQKTLSKLHPTSIIKQVHSSSSGDDDIREILKHTNTALKSQDISCLLCSPSMTNGVDFSYFDTVCVITDSPTQTPNLRFQAIRRDRSAKTIYYYTGKKTKGFKSGYRQEMLNQTTDWLSRNQIAYGLRRGRECARFPTTLRYYLLDQGAKVDVMHEEWEPLDYTESKREYEEERINAIVMANETYQAKRHNDAWVAKQECAKYYNLSSTSEVCEETAGWYVRDKPQKKMSFLNDIVQAGLWKVLRSCMLSAAPLTAFLQKDGHKFYQATGVSANPVFAKMYLGQCGIEIVENEITDFERVIRWYRTFCKINEMQIPKEFMTAEELLLNSESFLDISSGDNKPIKVPVLPAGSNGISWGSF
jgi:hypothetical protein